MCVVCVSLDINRESFCMLCVFIETESVCVFVEAELTYVCCVCLLRNRQRERERECVCIVCVFWRHKQIKFLCVDCVC